MSSILHVPGLMLYHLSAESNLKCEPTTYHMGGRHAIETTKPPRCLFGYYKLPACSIGLGEHCLTVLPRYNVKPWHNCVIFYIKLITLYDLSL